MNGAYTADQNDSRLPTIRSNSTCVDGRVAGVVEGAVAAGDRSVAIAAVPDSWTRGTAPGIATGKSAAVTTPPWLRTIRRSTAFFSSRTLPGQSYVCSASMASGASVGTSTP